MKTTFLYFTLPSVLLLGFSAVMLFLLPPYIAPSVDAFSAGAVLPEATASGQKRAVLVQYQRAQGEDIKVGDRVEIIPVSMNYGDSFSAELLPPGLRIDEKTGKIYGMPDMPGVYDSIVKVTREGNDHEVHVRFFVSKALPPPFLPLPRYSEEKFVITAGEKIYIKPVFEDATQAPRFRFTASEQKPLPPGIGISPSGIIQGIADDVDPGDKTVWESYLTVVTAGFGGSRTLKVAFEVKPAPPKADEQQVPQKDNSVAGFIKDFQNAHNGTAAEYASFFDSPSYYGQPNIRQKISREALQADRQKLISRYKERRYVHDPIKTRVIKSDDKSAVICVVMRYDYGNGQKSGTSTMDIELVWKGDRWLITSFKEKVEKL